MNFTHHPVEERHPLLLAGLLHRVYQVDGKLELRRQGGELRAHQVAFHHLATEAEAAGLDKAKNKRFNKRNNKNKTRTNQEGHRTLRSHR